MRLTVIRGLPGSGKSTYAKSRYDCLILENDMFQIADGEYRWSSDGTKRAIGLVMRTAEAALANGSDVCVANTFVRKAFVESYRMLAKRTGADFEVIRMTGDFGNVHSVPAATLENMRNRFEDWPGEKTVGSYPGETAAPRSV